MNRVIASIALALAFLAGLALNGYPSAAATTAAQGDCASTGSGAFTVSGSSAVATFTVTSAPCTVKLVSRVGTETIGQTGSSYPGTGQQSLAVPIRCGVRNDVTLTIGGTEVGTGLTCSVATTTTTPTTTSTATTTTTPTTTAEPPPPPTTTAAEPTTTAATVPAPAATVTVTRTRTVTKTVTVKAKPKPKKCVPRKRTKQHPARRCPAKKKAVKR